MENFLQRTSWITLPILAVLASFRSPDLFAAATDSNDPTEQAAVKAMQNQLRKLNLYTGPVNGVFNQATVNGVVKFKVSQGVYVTAIPYAMSGRVPAKEVETLVPQLENEVSKIGVSFSTRESYPKQNDEGLFYFWPVRFAWQTTFKWSDKKSYCTLKTGTRERSNMVTIAGSGENLAIFYDDGTSYTHHDLSALTVEIEGQTSLTLTGLDQASIPQSSHRTFLDGLRKDAVINLVKGQGAHPLVHISAELRGMPQALDDFSDCIRKNKDFLDRQ